MHSLIYPEMLAAREIVDAVKMSWIRQWWEFAGGALVLIGTKMRETAEILNVPLHELGGRNIPFHLVAIKRGNETIIPNGNDSIKLNDIVYFTTTKKYIPYIRKIAGKENYADIRNVMIMGGSRIAVRTAQYMPDYMRTKIIECDFNRCNRLTELVDDDVMVINGDGRDVELLLEEGIKNIEAFVALTGSSETNILACLAAKRLGVTKTVAEVENVDYISMAESLDIGAVINKKFIAASHIYQMMLDADVSNVKCLTFANADVAEFTVKGGSRITKAPIKDIGLPKGATIGGLIRNGEGIMVTGNTQLQEGDHVVVFCLGMMIKKLENISIKKESVFPAGINGRYKIISGYSLLLLLFSLRRFAFRSNGGSAMSLRLENKTQSRKIFQRLNRYLNAEWREGNSCILQKASCQLDEYFSGKRETFDIPLLTIGSPFQQDVWKLLQKFHMVLPYLIAHKPNDCRNLQQYGPSLQPMEPMRFLFLSPVIG